MTFIDYVGIAGGLLVLFSFYRTSIGKWTGKSMWYELDNLFGALFMAIYAFSKGAYVSIFLNLVWGAVALRGVTTLAERRMSRKLTKQRKAKKRKK
jgi:hypothetical protein